MEVLQGVALAAASLSVGYALGASFARPVGVKSSHPTTKSEQHKAQVTPPKEKEDDSEEEEDVADGDLTQVKPGMFEECKLVRVTGGCLGVARFDWERTGSGGTH